MSLIEQAAKRLEELRRAGAQLPEPHPPPGSNATPSDATLPLGFVPEDTVSGCQFCRQTVLVQMNLPACSPLRRYSVMPCALTRIVLAAEDARAPLVEDAGAPLLELEELPHALSSSAAASVGRMNFIEKRTVRLLRGMRCG